MEHELIDLERRGWEALAAGNGPGFFAEVCTDDAVMIFPDGLVLDRAAAVEGLRAEPPWASYELSDERVVAVGDDAGVVVYRAVARREGDEPYRAAMASTWVRRAGRWRLAVHQQTPV